MHFLRIFECGRENWRGEVSLKEFRGLDVSWLLWFLEGSLVSLSQPMGYQCGTLGKGFEKKKSLF